MTTASIPVVIEARHVRLTAGHVEILFGAGHALSSLVPLELTGRFAAAEVVEVRGPAGSCKNVRVLGPVVDATSVFVSDGDKDLLGAGDATTTCSVDGPKGTVVLGSSVVRPLRRLVVTRELAALHGLAVSGTQAASVDIVVQAERARELRNVPVELGPVVYLGVDVTDANAMDVGPTTRAQLSR